jgi:hypothetical protein
MPAAFLRRWSNTSLPHGACLYAECSDQTEFVADLTNKCRDARRINMISRGQELTQRNLPNSSYAATAAWSVVRCCFTSRRNLIECNEKQALLELQM